MDDVKKQMSCKGQRTVLKRKITLMLQKVDDDSLDNVVKSVRSFLEQIEICNQNIVENFFDDYEDEEVSDELDLELEKQLSYDLEVKGKISKLLKEKGGGMLEDRKPNSVTNCDLKLPHLECCSFSGEGNNHLEYASFISQYNNVVGLRSNLSNSTKFTYLKSFLKGYALKVVNHLQVADDNYVTALNLLETEFLNKEAIIDDLFAKLISLKPKQSNFLEVKLYINEMRCVLSDLVQYEVDLTRDPSSARFISHIFFANLPPILKQEFVRKLDCNYPTLNQIFDNYVEVIRTLNLRGGVNKFSGNSDAPRTKNFNTLSSDKKIL